MSFCWCLLDWALCLPMFLWCAQSIFFAECLPISLPNLSTGATLMFSRINPQFFSYICLMGWCVLSELVLNCVCQYLPDENPADVWLDWALCRQCLPGELSRCLPLSISRCLPPNLSKELLWCFPWTNPQSVLLYLSDGSMCSIWAGSQSCLPKSF